MSKKFFLIIILSFLIFLNITLVMIIYLLSNIFDINTFNIALFIVLFLVYVGHIYAAYKFVYYAWGKKVEHDFEVKEKYKKELIEAVKTTIGDKINDKINLEMDKNSIDSILKEIRREDNNIVFLRTLADAICTKDRKWDCKKIEKLLTAIKNISS